MFLMGLQVIAMMSATLVEKAGHSDLAFSYIYHSPVFIGLWACIAVLGILSMIAQKMHKRPAVLGIHVAFLLILLGAAVTHFSSEQGRIHLCISESTSCFEDENGSSLDMPFSIMLKDFQVVRSAGGAAIDYISTVETDRGETEIAMNRIFNRKGYRIFQAGYDEDELGAYFSVSYDPAGTGISYTGYWMLFACMLIFFFDGKSRFRESLRRVMALSVIGFAIPAVGHANTAVKTLPEEIASQFGELYVNYNGRICQVQSMARDYVLKVYGKQKVMDCSAEQVFTGWLYFYDSWKDVPVKAKKQEVGGPKELEKQQIVLDIASGRDLKIFPVERPEGLVWYAAASKLPVDMDSGEWLFIREVNSLISEYAFKGDWEAVSSVLAKIAKHQQQVAGSVLPDAGVVKAERLYNAIGRPFVPAMAALTLGIILFLIECLGIASLRRRLGVFQLAVHVLSWTCWMYLSLILGLRWYVSGHIPMANGHEMMMIIAWTSLLITSLLGLRMCLLHPFGFILSGFAMLVASLGQASPQIGTLMPVLSSPLLSIHVGLMMLSYTLLGLLALNGLLGLFGHQRNEAMDRGVVILYPALFFLIAGTFVGAIWANISWGSYWNWDPKETWALITVLVYSAALHSRSLRSFGNPVFFNAFCVLAFLCVLITYFGVNFFLGGAHSYA